MKNGGMYKTGVATVEAHQWHENGDHPRDNSREITVNDETFLSEGELVRRFRSSSPAELGERACDECGHIFHVHGWIDVGQDGHKVCPGDYVVTNENGDIYPVHEKIFIEEYNLQAGYGG